MSDITALIGDEQRGLFVSRIDWRKSTYLTHFDNFLFKAVGPQVFLEVLNLVG